MTGLTKLIKVKASEQDSGAAFAVGSHRPGSVADGGASFPSFFWVLRDFALELVDKEGDSITPDDYLESALESLSRQENEGESDKSQRKRRNEVRRTIKAFFPTRRCVTLVRPCNDEEKLQTLNLQEFESLRPEFQTQMIAFREQVVHSCTPKSVLASGRGVNGRALLGLAQSYVDAINAGGVPTIASAWGDVQDKECRRALKEALRGYMGAMEGEREEIEKQGDNEEAALFAKVRDEKELLLMHDKSKEAALLHYTRFSAGESAEEYKEKLLMQIMETLNSAVAKNVSLSRIACKALLARLRVGIDKKLSVPIHEILPKFDSLLNSNEGHHEKERDDNNDEEDGSSDKNEDEGQKGNLGVSTPERSTLLLSQFAQLESVHKEEVKFVNEALVTYGKLARGPEKAKVL